jgi:hypothetical protein
VFTKGPYFVDFPTTITQLADLQDKTTQVDYFRMALEKALEEININDNRFKAEVLPWDKFKLFCKEIEEQETKEKQADVVSISSGHLGVGTGDQKSASSSRALTPMISESGDGSADDPAATAEWVEAEPEV